jgi:cell division septum initiation protein DivIVA
MERLDRKDRSDAAFDIVLRGYDKRQVDERLHLLGSELTAVENALLAASQQAANLADSNLADSNFGARVEKILKLAQDEAREVRTQADAVAAALVEQARAEADQIRAAVAAEVVQIRKAVAAEADKAFQAAAVDADKVTKAARVEADHLVVQARAEAERLVAVATDTAHQQGHSSSAHELHQLARLRDEINADLYRVKETLDSLFGTARAISGATIAPILPKRSQDSAHLPQRARTV